MAKKKPIAKLGTQPYPRKSVECQAGQTEAERMRHYAALATSPELAAYRVINRVEETTGIGTHIDVPTLMAHLRNQGKAVNGGDLSEAEAMLMNQATALQSLFAQLAERAMVHDQIPGFDANMRMALRAQNQCRATLETLAALKNPPTIYARQANVTTGLQQVNNGLPSRVRESENEPTQLLRADHGERMDSGTTGTAIGRDPEMATLGTLHGAEVRRG